MRDTRPLTPEVVKEVFDDLDAEGFFESFMEKAFPDKFPSAESNNNSNKVAASLKRD